MAIQFVTYDDNSLENGKFYDVKVNKDLASAVIETAPHPIYFTNMKYMKVELPTNHSLEIWETREREGKKVKMNVTGSLFWYIEEETNSLIVFSNIAIDGFIKFI